MMMGQKKDANTLLLLHAEDFTDSSMYARPITNVGAEIVAGKFGNCLSFDGSSYISFPETIGLNSDFTVDFWIKIGIYKYEYPLVLGLSNDHNSWSISVFISNNGYIQFTRYDTSSSHVAYNFTDKITLDAWHHVAFVKSGDYYYGFLDGVLQHTSVLDHVFSGTAPFNSYLGVNMASSSYIFNGQIDEFRISNIARWTASFTPPTAPYTI